MQARLRALRDVLSSEASRGDRPAPNIGDVFRQDFAAAPRRVSHFAGPLWRIAAHCQHLVACRKRKAAERKEAAVRRGSRKIAESWNQGRLRVGDECDLVKGDDEVLWVNQIKPQQIMVQAWKSVGTHTTERIGLDGHRKGLAMLSATAMVLDRLQERWAAERRDSIVAGRHCPVIVRFYDATPIRVEFGKLADTLHDLK